jgi:hypothetical protein
MQRHEEHNEMIVTKEPTKTLLPKAAQVQSPK